MYCQTFGQWLGYTIILIILIAVVEAAMNMVGLGHILNPWINMIGGLFGLYLLGSWLVGMTGAFACNPGDSLLHPFSAASAVMPTA